jgi:type IV pilus biogenesis protein CpaD/CtpE
MNTKSALAAAALLSLTACVEQDLKSMPYMGGPDNFGEANKQTMAAQVIDPSPVYLNPVPISSGEHAAQAVERYREDKVKQPDRVATTDAGVEAESRDGN